MPSAGTDKLKFWPRLKMAGSNRKQSSLCIEQPSATGARRDRRGGKYQLLALKIFHRRHNACTDRQPQAEWIADS